MTCICKVCELILSSCALVVRSYTIRIWPNVPFYQMTYYTHLLILHNESQINPRLGALRIWHEAIFFLRTWIHLIPVKYFQHIYTFILLNRSIENHLDWLQLTALSSFQSSTCIPKILMSSKYHENQTVCEAV